MHVGAIQNRATKTNQQVARIERSDMRDARVPDVASLIRATLAYDNVSAIKKLHVGFSSITYSVGYTGRAESRKGGNVLFFTPSHSLSARQSRELK
jgi:hypothetical protein